MIEQNENSIMLVNDGREREMKRTPVGPCGDGDWLVAAGDLKTIKSFRVESD